MVGFCVDLKQWYDIMKTYEGGAHKYYTTMPTDALTHFYHVMVETEQLGIDKVKAAQLQLGADARAMMKELGLKSVAADGFASPG